MFIESSKLQVVFLCSTLLKAAPHFAPSSPAAVCMVPSQSHSKELVGTWWQQTISHVMTGWLASWREENPNPRPLNPAKPCLVRPRQKAAICLRQDQSDKSCVCFLRWIQLASPLQIDGRRRHPSETTRGTGPVQVWFRSGSVGETQHLWWHSSRWQSFADTFGIESGCVVFACI